MKINATQTRDIRVDITPGELSAAILNCAEISLSDMVELLRKKFLNLVVKDDRLFIENGIWQNSIINSLGKHVSYPGHHASETEIEVYAAIEALDAVMIMEKLKGNKKSY